MMNWTGEIISSRQNRTVVETAKLTDRKARDAGGCFRFDGIKLFEEALKTQPEPHLYSADGVHPNANGAEFIGKKYFEAVLPLVKDCISSEK